MFSTFYGDTLLGKKTPRCGFAPRYRRNVHKRHARRGASVDESPPGFEINTSLAFKYSAILFVLRIGVICPFFANSVSTLSNSASLLPHKNVEVAVCILLKYGSSARTAFIIDPAPMLPPESSSVRLSFGKLSASRALSFVMVSSENPAAPGCPAAAIFSQECPPGEIAAQKREGVTDKSQVRFLRKRNVRSPSQ